VGGTNKAEGIGVKGHWEVGGGYENMSRKPPQKGGGGEKFRCLWGKKNVRGWQGAKTQKGGGHRLGEGKSKLEEILA